MSLYTKKMFNVNTRLVDIKTLRMPEYYEKDLIDERRKTLIQSIKKYGVDKPLLVNENPERKNIIIDGAQVYSVCIELGIQEVPVWFINAALHEEKAKAVLYNLKVASVSEKQLRNLLSSSYEEFMGIEEFNSPLLDNAFNNTQATCKKLKKASPVSIKKISLILSPEEHDQLKDVMREIGAKNISNTVCELIKFYMKGINHA